MTAEPKAVQSNKLTAVIWADNNRVLVRLPMPVPALLLAGKFAALLLGRTQRGLLIEYGPERAAACSELGLNPDSTLLFLRKPRSTRAP